MSLNSIQNIKNILVRAPNWIGDIILATPALSSLRETYPNAHISVLIKNCMIPLLADNKDVDEIIPLSPDDISLCARLVFYRSLRFKKFDLAVLLTNSFESALAAFLCRAEERLGYQRDLRSLLLTKTLDTPVRSSPRMHQSEYYLNLIRAVGGGDISPKPRLIIPCSISEEVDRLWKRLYLEKSRFIVGFGAGAAHGSAKRWPVDRFGQLGNLIVKEMGGRIIIFGGKEDQEAAEKILKRIEWGGISMAGKTTLKSLAAMIKRCHLYITNDSGPMHIASAVGTPIIAIFGSTDPSETSPLSDYIIVRKETSCSPCWKKECNTDHRCMQSITVEDVMEAVKTLKHRAYLRNSSASER